MNRRSRIGTLECKVPAVLDIRERLRAVHGGSEDEAYDPEHTFRSFGAILTLTGGDATLRAMIATGFPDDEVVSRCIAIIEAWAGGDFERLVRAADFGEDSGPDSDADIELTGLLAALAGYEPDGEWVDPWSRPKL